jgi:hypothetical protein
MEEYKKQLLNMGLSLSFPVLEHHDFTPTSPHDYTYNCIAWAAGDNLRWWWPQGGVYWPPNIKADLTLDSFKEAFGQLGYIVCDDGGLEAGFEKVAFYAINGEIKHASRQLVTGKWTSKIGMNIDMEHTLDGLVGPEYGSVIGYMKRPQES